MALSRRNAILLSVLLSIAAVVLLIIAAVQVYSAGIYADETGTTGSIPVVAWVLAAAAAAAVVGAIGAGRVRHHR